MKKILFLTCLMILIPFMIVTIFKTEDHFELHISSSTKVKIKREATGTIEEIPFEDYVIGVVAGEMPVSFELEALKAQAVAARSYVMRRMRTNQGKDYDVVDTVMNQVYLDQETLKQKWQDKFLERYQKLEEAVISTRGEYLDYQGQIADAMFFSTSTGATENSEEVFVSKVPYLRSVASTWDEEVSPVFEEHYTFSVKEFSDKLKVSYQPTVSIELVEATSTGRVKKIKINGTEFTGSNVAGLLQLRSNFFTITQSGATISITTKGYGHGVGMSQYGALGMAKVGYTYDQILKYYYQGVEIKKI